MLYDYILKITKKMSQSFVRASRRFQRLRSSGNEKLVDDGKLERLFNGVYYLSYTTILGTKGKMSIDKYVDKKIY